MTHTDPGKRHDFVLLFDVVNGNPNGDPDAGNRPRVDPETMHGLVTDVALKRKVRDYAALYRQQQIFIQSQVALNTLILRAYQDTGVQPPQVPLDDDEAIAWLGENAPEGFVLEGTTLIYGGSSTSATDIQAELEEGLEGSEVSGDLRKKLRALPPRIAAAQKRQQIGRGEQVRARDQLCRAYYDIRMFGAVLSTGLNAGQVRGPVQLTFARSIDPVLPLDLPITRQARTTTARMRTGSTEIGRKPMVPYGLYRAHGFFNPHFAGQTGVTEEDMRLLWEALATMFDFDRTASRGEMATRGLYIFTHDNPLGNAPAHRLFERVRVVRHEGVETPRAFEDYAVMVESETIPAGVTLTDALGA